MVIGSASSAGVLVTMALPIGACAVQDVGAFALAMGKGGHSNRVLTAFVVVFALSFPLGALISYCSFGRAETSPALLVLRTAVAGVFVYMALFEFAPPHAHQRATAAVYAACFVAGAGLAYGIEELQDYAAASHG